MPATKHVTLQAGVAQTITLDGIIRGFRVTHRGTDGDADVWWTFAFNTAVTATVEGDDTYNLPAAQQDDDEDVAYRARKFGGGIESTKFSLISTGAVPVSVETW